MVRNGASMKSMVVYAIHEPRSTRVRLVARRGKTGYGPIAAVLSADPSWAGWRFLVDQYLAFLRSEYDVSLDRSLLDLLS